MALCASAWGQQTSLSEVQKLADAGNAEAQFTLGNLYYEGYAGFTQSYAEAVKWYKKAAEQGHGDASFNLFVCYKFGHGTQINEKEAWKWLQNAADNGVKEAQYNLGVSYEYGKGVAQSYTQAAKWYKKAAEQNDSTALVNLGILYYKGQGVTQSVDQAKMHLKKAADLGSVAALYNLGVIFSELYGDVEGLSWYKKAAEKGNVESMYEVGMYYLYSLEEFDEARPWLRKAADKGHVGSMSALGDCIWNEAETVAELEQALYWLRKADDEGDVYAADIIPFVEEDLEELREEEAAKKAEEARKNNNTASVPAYTPSYSSSYSSYRRHSFNTPYWDERPWGWSIGLVQKQWSYRPRPEYLDDYGDVEELYGVFSDDGEDTSVRGLQLGLRYQSQLGGGFGINTGVFYELYSDQSLDYFDDEGYEFKSIWEEHSLNIPLHLEFRANFSEGFQLFAYGGGSVDLGLSSTFRYYYYDDNWTSDKFNAYGREYEMLRYNASWEAGIGVRFNSLQIQYQMSRGLIDMAEHGAEYTVFQNKPMTLTFSWMF